MKEAIKKIVLKLWPELESKVHLPLLAVVVGIPDPPTGGETFTHERPLYAVDVQLLTENGDIDTGMPVMYDVPVAMTASAPDRGFAALPQVGTVVEIAFAFGRQDQPFIRSVLPYEKSLPTIDAKTMRWQQTALSYQQVDEPGNWHLETNLNVSCHVGMNMTQAIDMNWDRTILLNYTEKIGVNYTSTIGLNYTGTVLGTYTSTVMLARTETVNESWSRQTIKSLTETVGQNYHITVGAAFGETVVGTWTRQGGAINETAMTVYTLTSPMIYEGDGFYNLWEIVHELTGICSGVFNGEASSRTAILKSRLSGMIELRGNVWVEKP